MPGCCHQRNQSSHGSRLLGFADSRGQKPDQRRVQFIPEIYCKSFAIETKNRKDAVEWHRVVTGVQHRSRNEIDQDSNG
jgi:hypothetical protein